MTAPFKAACLQLTPGNDLSRNLAEIAALASAAAAEGAGLVALPEFTTYLDRSSKSMRASATQEAESTALSELRSLAQRLDVWLLAGSLVILREDDPEQRLANRSFLIASTGAIAARYDKIHMFDARLSDGRTVGESRHYAGGSRAVVVRTPLGAIGMSVCYDLRFPHLYRELARGGAQLLAIPSAFTAETGAAHWEPLLRARAIETGCFVLAPATSGTHPGDWQTYGHASIIDPWGRVLDSCGEEPGFCVADIDVALCDEVRSRIPSLGTNPEFRLVREDFYQPSRGGNHA
jgi:deaminated glutathione amidase